MPADGEPPRPEDERLLPAVEETLGALELGADGLAAAQIARRYAQIIDAGKDPAWCLRWIGPLLLQALTELRATPASRPAATPVDRAPSQLDRLRSARRGGV
jgi:hypothetical protein